MKRRDFMKTGVLGAATAYVPPHNFDKYDFGRGPTVRDRLNQGPFPADLYPSWIVVMALTPSDEVVPNYGMGMVNDLCDEVGLDTLPACVRQAQFPLPKGTAWQGLGLKAQIEVKGQTYRVRWACRQRLNADGSLTLRATNGLNVSDETGGL